ncbi:glycosyltransferase [Sphingobacterium sp. HJSM2_6]|uniref:glycosyltransferase n=1 Tax=Sphingobacterium sp. HJSM2_6 TaxID=3366264 RepID=UPI003BBA8395
MRANFKQTNIISLTDMAGGAENVMLKLAKAVNAKLIFVKKSSESRLDIPNQISVKYLSNGSIILGLLKLIPLLVKFKEDEILMSTHPYLNAFLGFFKRIGYLKTQLIVRECTSVFTRFSGLKKITYLFLYRLGYPAADLVICQTDIMKDQLLKHNVFISQNRVLVQQNPLDLSEMYFLAKQFNIHEEAEFICAAGRLIPEKGFDILIKTFKIIHKSYPQLKLFLLGEGRERSALIKLIEDHNLQSAVFLKGYIANPAPYFKSAKLCVVSSLKEGFPNVLLEMMALNQSVVSTICAGGISTIPNITTVEVNNVEALAQAILNTLLKPKIQNYNPHLNYLQERSVEKFAKSIFIALAQQG